MFPQEFDKLKEQSTTKKPAPQPEKKRTRLKIEEVEDESDSDDQSSKPASSSKPSKPLTPTAKPQGQCHWSEMVVSNNCMQNIVWTRCASGCQSV